MSEIYQEKLGVNEGMIRSISESLKESIDIVVDSNRLSIEDDEILAEQIRSDLRELWVIAKKESLESIYLDALFDKVLKEEN